MQSWWRFWRFVRYSLGAVTLLALALVSAGSAGVGTAGATSTVRVTTSSPLPPATVDSAYSKALGVTGGTRPYSWRIGGGSLPPGLSLGAGGLIQGTPTAAGTSSFTAVVTDANSAVGSATLSITVARAATVTSASATPAATDVGQSVTYQASVTDPVPVSGGSVTFAVGSTTLCTGSVVNGMATCSSSSAPPGTSTVSAAYGGSSNDLPSRGTTTVAVALETWPEMRYDTTSSGTSPDTVISNADATQLGVRWMTSTGRLALASPVTAWSSTLKKTLVFVGNDAGYLTAYDQQTGLPVWSDQLGGPQRSSPIVDGPYLWVGATVAGRLYKLNAATGATVCSVSVVGATGENIDSSPVLATPPGGHPTVYIGVNDAGPNNGPLTAVNETNCAVQFKSTPEPVAGTGGIWDPISYGVDRSGEPLVFFGTADPDSAVYAIDAVTGALVWRLAAVNPAPYTYDVGAGITVSPPGANGFADGVVYVESKHGELYALDMGTGSVVWQLSNPGLAGLGTAALTGNTLVATNHSGVTAINATTGAVLWQYSDTAGVDASPAITGPAGHQVVALADLAGKVIVLDLGTGSVLYTFQTANFATSSPAVSNGNIIESSGDGFVYDFAVGGDQASPPTTSISSPADGTTAGAVNGHVAVTGSAAGASPIGEVTLMIQEGGSAGPWWDGATGTWTVAPYPNPTVLSSPGTTATNWSFQLPVSPTGGQFSIFASAVNTAGMADGSAEQSAPSSARVAFSVSAAAGAAMLTSSAPYAAPGSSLTVSGSGFPANTAVSISLGTATLATVSSNANGSFPATVVAVPANAPFGPQAIQANATSASPVVASVAIYVTNSWDQVGGNPAQTFSDPNDAVLSQHLSVSSGSFLNEAWSFRTAAPVAGGAAVADGSAYVADTSGDLYAVNVRSANQEWLYQDGGAAFTGTPALAGGLVLVGTAGGQLLAVNDSSGTLAWSQQLSTSTVEPVAVSGSTIYVTTSDGTLSALALHGGATLWTVSLAGPTTSTPAVDPTTGLVVVGDSTGAVSAYSSSGVLRWRKAPGGAVEGAPSIARGLVYVGSADDHVYALEASTGSLSWSFQSGGPITMTPAVTNIGVVVGSGDGNDYFLNPTTGALIYPAVSVGSAVTGVGAAQGFAATASTGGVLEGSKPQATDPHAWSATPGGTLAAAPTVVNGEVFVTTQTGKLNCYTVPGLAPA